MGLDSTYNEATGYEKKNKWVKPEIYYLNIKKTHGGINTLIVETFSGQTSGFAS